MSDNRGGNRFSSLSRGARVLWAKSGQEFGHGLLAHLLDVAAVAEVLLEWESPATRLHAANMLGLQPSQVARWVAALAGLHDFGKAIPGFQAKWPEGRSLVESCGFPFLASALKWGRHSLATAALLSDPLSRLSGAAGQWCSHVVLAVSAHHGYHFLPTDIENGFPPREGMGWSAARSEILLAYWQALSPGGIPSANKLDLATVNWLAGLTSVADWIASNPIWFPLGERHDDLREFHADAKSLATRSLAGIGWTRYRPLLEVEATVDDIIARIVQRSGVQTARPLQVAGDELLRDVRGPALMLVEAPMGEGKTELAFLAHLRLQAANHHRGFYVALPTQATGNALFKRAMTFLRAFVEETTDVQLVHGGAQMNADLQALRDIDHSDRETLSASAWFGQRRRPMLSPYGVGTVDQALYAVLNVKHHFVRLWGLSNRVVVLDEVHAYDAYTSDLIAMLLRWLKAMGSSVVLMSATLPAARRDLLLQAWGVDSDTVPRLSYPRLLLADESGLRHRETAARPLPLIHLRGLDSNVNELVARAMLDLASGGCGAIIVNTVQRAQEVFRMLQLRHAEMVPHGDDETVLVLFHARFPADERSELENRVLGLFSEQVERPRRALMVATQVAEQSLDIDFDFMITDLAPVDLLLQRAGRLHRHKRERPEAHREPVLHVAGLLPDALPDMKGTAWGFVYDTYILGRTWALLRDRTTLALPGDIDRLVQQVYAIDDPLPDNLDDAVREVIEVDALGEWLARVKNERQRAFNIVITPDAEPESAYIDKPAGHEEDELGLGLENATRLGPESVTLVPVLQGEEGRWHVQAGDAGFLPDQQLDPGTARALYNRQIKVSRKAVVAHFNARPTPSAFESHALLRSTRPMPLVDGRYMMGRQSLRLHSELGLVYEASEATPPFAMQEKT